MTTYTLYESRISYTGNRGELESFADALINAGFSPMPDDGFSEWSIYKTTILTTGSGVFGYFNHKGEMADKWFTSGQFQEALNAATKKF